MTFQLLIILELRKNWYYLVSAMEIVIYYSYNNGVYMKHFPKKLHLDKRMITSHLHIYYSCKNKQALLTFRIHWKWENVTTRISKANNNLFQTLLKWSNVRVLTLATLLFWYATLFVWTLSISTSEYRTVNKVINKGMHKVCPHYKRKDTVITIRCTITQCRPKLYI